MTRCIYCHLIKELDSKSRCSSCADAGDATAYGLHYGDYMAAKPRPYVLPVAITPLRDLRRTAAQQYAQVLHSGMRPPWDSENPAGE